MIVHIDCNSYFASCEIADRPQLKDEPVVVCSSNENNGGIILALNGPAKKLGLKRGNPMFQVAKSSVPEGFYYQGRLVHCFEVDHHKYHLISDHIMHLVQEQDIVTDFVQYSVDEFFGVIPVDDPDEMRAYTQQVKDMIERETSIPVSCGCSLSYTLAKVATHFAKRHEGYHGICVLPADKREAALALLPIEDVWGIGRKVYPKLQKMGWRTALDFANLPVMHVAEIFNATMVHTWEELNGKPAIMLENRKKKQSIAHSRTLAYTSHDKVYLLSLLDSYVACAAKEMRAQKSKCKQLTVFMNTNYHRQDLPQYTGKHTLPFSDYEDTTFALMRKAKEAFEAMWRDGYEIKRLGVQLEKLADTEDQQMALDFDLDPEATRQKNKHRRLQAAVDAINDKFQKEVVHSGGYLRGTTKNSGLTMV